jgi:putative membrane protein
MSTEDSMNGSMNSAVKHYSSLFFLPSFRKTFAALAVLCVGVVGLSTFVLFPSFEGLLNSLSLGVALLAVTLLCDYATITLVLRGDPIFVWRRTAALSLFSWILWLGFIFPGALVGAAFGFWIWVKLCLLGFATILTLRAVVFFSTSTAGPIRAALASFLQPFLCIIPFLVYWATFNQTDLLQVLPFLIVAPFLTLASANFFVSLIDRLGRKLYGIPSMSLFKAFMLNWVEGLNAPIESYLERLGQDEDVEVSLLKFESVKTKAAIIVPLVHPGPFNNVGSSLLPSLLKREFEKAFGGDACVPLGILGHELDLASQKQNQRIISSVIASAKEAPLSEKAKPFVKVTEGAVTVSCQVFGKTALLSFTLAPKTTEDLPQELGRFVREEAEKHGLEGAIVVNAHNSITNVTELEESLDTLKVAASKCLERAISLPPEVFEVGAATVYPQDFRLKEGMGTGGITAIVVKVNEQKAAYVVIDGNNMVSGLREKILSALAALGFDESEVFTTDTHAVNAVVLGRRGYHPVGEAMNHEVLLSHIQQAASAAVARLAPCSAGWLTLTVPKVRVIGQARINGLSTLVDAALQRAKRIVVPIFALEGLLLVLLLAVL